MMKCIQKRVCVVVVIGCLLLGSIGQALAANATAAEAPTKAPPGVEAAHALSLITGVAISPLLGVGAVGAYHYWKAPPEQRSRLPWYAQPWFFIPALLLVGLVAAKDTVGTAAPGVLKKPFDVAETIENKISGLVVAGAFIPLVISIFPEAPGTEVANLSAAGFAIIDPGALANALLVPFAIIAFAVVWLAGHSINVLILMSPFSTVDAALKVSRLAILGLVTGTAFVNPYVGAVFALMVMVVAWLIAGWSFRLMIFGMNFTWDFVTFRKHRFQPGSESNRMFTARAIEGAPIRTCGKLTYRKPDSIWFEYRPLLILPRRRFALPPGKYVVERGFVFPEICSVTEDKLLPTFLLPPCYCGHEEALARAYSFPEVRDTVLLKGCKKVWGWFRSLAGVDKPAMEPLPPPAGAAV